MLLLSFYISLYSSKSSTQNTLVTAITLWWCHLFDSPVALTAFLQDLHHQSPYQVPWQWRRGGVWSKTKKEQMKKTNKKSLLNTITYSNSSSSNNNNRGNYFCAFEGHQFLAGFFFWFICLVLILLFICRHEDYIIKFRP